MSARYGMAGRTDPLVGTHTGRSQGTRTMCGPRTRPTQGYCGLAQKQSPWWEHLCNRSEARLGQHRFVSITNTPLNFDPRRWERGLVIFTTQACSEPAHSDFEKSIGSINQEDSLRTLSKKSQLLHTLGTPSFCACLTDL